MTKAEAIKLLGVAVAAYPSTKIDPEGVRSLADVWHTALGDLDFDLAKRAIMRHIGLSKWMPTVADVRRAAMDLSAGPPRAPGDAWGDVMRAIGRWGRFRTPGVDFAFADPLVAEVVKAIGWQTICTSELLAAERARFIETYERMSENEASERQVRGLPGASSPARVGGTTIAAAIRELTGGHGDAVEE